MNIKYRFGLIGEIGIVLCYFKVSCDSIGQVIDMKNASLKSVFFLFEMLQSSLAIV